MHVPLYVGHWALVSWLGKGVFSLPEELRRMFQVESSGAIPAVATNWNLEEPLWVLAGPRRMQPELRERGKAQGASSVKGVCAHEDRRPALPRSALPHRGQHVGAFPG